jgi:hypothetical protein
MLDDCKGERLEELLAVFSNAVLKRAIQAAAQATTVPIAQQLAFENFSYSGERTALSTLILAHKASLQGSLRDRKDANARYHDFAELLNLNERRVTRRHEQLKQATQEREPEDTLSTRETHALQDQITNNWSGREDWLEALLYGDTKARSEDLLSADLHFVWRHVEGGTLGDIEERKHTGLLEQLDARVKSQEARLTRWQDFSKTLSKSGAPSPAKAKGPTEVKEKRIDLGFNLHQNLQISKNNAVEIVEAPTHESFKEYTQLIGDMKDRLADVGQPPTVKQVPVMSEDQSPEVLASITSPPLEKDESASANDDWSSVSDTEEAEPNDNDYAKEPFPTPQIDPDGASQHHDSNYNSTQTDDLTSEVLESSEDLHEAMPRSQGAGSASPEFSRSQTPPSNNTRDLNYSDNSETDLADLILNSVSASSPSPKKARHTLSLAERTRLSMSRASNSQYSDLHDDIDKLADLPRPKRRQSPPKAPPSSEEKHADLIERTRLSMVGFEAAQKKAQLERRRSIKDAKKRQRESNYFPKVDEEPSRRNIDHTDLIEGDPDYESVFKSRPKIKTSPAVSPTRTGNED